MTMHHFFLSVLGEARPMSTPFLPRVGDTIVIDGAELWVRKVTWVSNGRTIDEKPIITAQQATTDPTVYVDHILGPDDDLTDAARFFASRHKSGAASGSGGKISAIKDLRAHSSVGLKDAKEIIDKIWDHV